MADIETRVGTFSAMKIEDSGPPILSMTAFVTDPNILQHAMKSVAQVGLAALFIFQHIFKAKFELLGIKAEMNRLRRENLWTRTRQATAEPSPALCAIGSSGLVSPRTRFQLTLAHNALVNLTNAFYLVFKFAVVLWQSLDHNIRSLRHVQANGACRKQPLADLEFVLTHNATRFIA